MKKKVNIFLIIIMVFMIINVFNINESMAAHQQTIVQDGGGRKTQSTTINPDDYEPSAPTTDDAGEVVEKVGVILGAVRNISAVVAVITLMIIGFKYIIGSAEEKANYKASMWPYIVGCIMAVAGTTLVDFIYKSIH